MNDSTHCEGGGMDEVERLLRQHAHDLPSVDALVEDHVDQIVAAQRRITATGTPARRRRFVPSGRSRRTIAIIAALAVLVVPSLALAGELPRPIQEAAAKIGDAIGIDVPEPRRTNSEAQAATGSAPGSPTFELAASMQRLMAAGPRAYADANLTGLVEPSSSPDPRHDGDTTGAGSDDEVSPDLESDAGSTDTEKSPAAAPSTPASQGGVSGNGNAGGNGNGNGNAGGNGNGNGGGNGNGNGNGNKPPGATKPPVENGNAGGNGNSGSEGNGGGGNSNAGGSGNGNGGGNGNGNGNGDTLPPAAPGDGVGTPPADPGGGNGTGGGNGNAGGNGNGNGNGKLNPDA